jgi:hypothetical protein
MQNIFQYLEKVKPRVAIQMYLNKRPKDANQYFSSQSWQIKKKRSGTNKQVWGNESWKAL